MDAENNKKLNRRRSFRIYEQVDLYYQKLDNTFALSSETAVASHSSLKEPVPESLTQENDTLNVNISATGISFTCKEKLNPGDYVMIRVLMLSRMTLVMSGCKVVYCKPSNPFEPNRYPYQVGAQFVNLRDEDKALLTRYVDKARSRQLINWGLITTLFFSLLVYPEVFLELIHKSGALLIESFLKAVFFLNEFIGYLFDELVMSIFHTDLRATQISSFYLQFTLYVVIGLYLSVRVIPTFLKNLIYQWRVFYFRKKSSIAYYWKEQSLLKKTLITGLISVLLAGYGYSLL